MLINLIKPANVNLKHYSGDKLGLHVSITHSDDTAYVLTGKSLRMQIKKKKTNSTSLIELVTPTEIQILGASANEIKSDEVVSLAGGTYFYDIQNTTDHVTLMKGEFEVEYDVTRIEPTTTAAPTTTA